MSQDGAGSGLDADLLGKAQKTIDFAAFVLSDRSVIAALSEAASRGELELNAFLPLIADCLLEDLTLLKNAVRLFRESCVELLQPDAARCRALLDGSLARATAFTPALGYDAVAEAVEKCGDDPEPLYEELERRKSKTE